MTATALVDSPHSSRTRAPRSTNETMTYVNPERFQTALGRTRVILAALVADLSQSAAARATDGPDGWSVIEVVCHLRDFEGFFLGRAELMVTGGNPQLPAYDHEQLARERDYAHQELRQALRDYRRERERHLAFLAGLSPEQWSASGVHPEMGPITLLDQTVQVSLHDLDHTHQIVKCLGRATGA